MSESIPPHRLCFLRKLCRVTRSHAIFLVSCIFFSQPTMCVPSPEFSLSCNTFQEFNGDRCRFTVSSKTYCLPLKHIKAFNPFVSSSFIGFVDSLWPLSDIDVTCSRHLPIFDGAFHRTASTDRV